LYYSIDDGNQWVSDNTGLTNLNVRGIIVNDSYIFIGTDAAIWRRPLTEITTSINRGKDNSPENFTLYPAYPNPFNPSVTLSYSLTKDARTSLKVYNVLGQAVATIVDTWQGSGNYSYTWQPQNLSAGIYLVRLESGNKTNLQKVVFVK
jgi:hypothetical protein